MLVAISGTPGTGKTSISKEVSRNGFKVIDLNNIAYEKNFIIEKDQKRNQKLKKSWEDEFELSD